MSGIRQLARTAHVSSRLGLRTAVSPRGIHFSQSNQKGVLGYIFGGEKKNPEPPREPAPEREPEAKQSSSVTAAPPREPHKDKTDTRSSPATTQAPPPADAVLATKQPASALAPVADTAAESTTGPAVKGAKPAAGRPDGKAASKRPGWPKSKKLARPTTANAHPRHLPPSLDLLSDHSHPLSEAERRERFDVLLKHVGDRIGRTPAVRDALQIRDSSWNQLIQLAASKEQIDAVAEIMPKWVESKREFKPAVASLFIERAHQLGATPVALRVFIDYMHYGLKVPSLDDAASLMSSAMQKSQKPDHATLQNLVALVTVMRLQRLPPLSSSLLATCTFAGALAHPRMRSPKAHPVLLSLLPGFKSLVQAHPAVPAEWRKRLAPWLTSVQSYLRLHGVFALWLRRFRKENGMLPAYAERTTWATVVRHDARVRRAALKEVADPAERKAKAEEMVREQRKRMMQMVKSDVRFARSRKAVPSQFADAPAKAEDLLASA